MQTKKNITNEHVGHVSKKTCFLDIFLVTTYKCRGSFYLDLMC